MSDEKIDGWAREQNACHDAIKSEWNKGSDGIWLDDAKGGGLLVCTASQVDESGLGLVEAPLPVLEALLSEHGLSIIPTTELTQLRARIEELEGELAQFTACKALDKPHDPSDPSVVILTIHRGGPIGGGPKDNGGT